MDRFNTVSRVFALTPFILGLVTGWRVLPAHAGSAIPAYITTAIADPARPAAEVSADVRRKPAETLQFAAVQPGQRVADFMSGGGYFTRLLSRTTGKEGRVYAFLPTEQLKNCAPEETSGTLALRKDSRYSNVTVLTGPVNRFQAPEPLDMILTSLNFHDLYDKFMGPADVRSVTRSLFDALKPGGVFLVIDHVADPGSGTRDTDSLHRIDPQVIIRSAQAAGFRLEAQSDLLRNAQDDHTLLVFDPRVRGRTDQVILRFRKP